MISISGMIGLIKGLEMMMMRRNMICITRMIGLIRGWVRKPMGSLRGEGTC